ncbi:MAG: hypothetical protein P1U58_20460 [Verrucomicrobiales bacterium]|nr:hypothetical protein [Verrucomicrobiales bacterium]
MDSKTTGTRKRFFITASIFAAAHFIPQLGCMVVSIGSSMSRFDDPAAHPAMVDEVVGKIAEVMMQPGAAIWDSMPRDSRPDLLECPLFFGNSLLRGAVLAFILQGMLHQRKRKNRS